MSYSGPRSLPPMLRTGIRYTDSASNGPYTWNVPNNLPDGSDYALELLQADSINYSCCSTLFDELFSSSSGLSSTSSATD